MKPEWPLGGDVVEGINYPSGAFQRRLLRIFHVARN